MALAFEGEEPEQSFRQLADGFTALCDEYKSLAERHNQLERRLAATVQECESLRKLLPDDKVQGKVPKVDSVLSSQVKPTQNFDEWLEQLVNDGNTDALARIKLAIAACFKYEHRLKSNGQYEPTTQTTKLNEPQRRIRPSIKKKRPSYVEEDFTIAGTPGDLGCPYASKSKNNDSLQLPNNEIPTPRSSASHPRNHSRQRSVLTDPLLQQSKSTAGHTSNSPNSTAGSTNAGPACPIRFLDQHSPEQIAAYFEEHKHELPRSHELCVKRFQSNAQHLRELDAKYGNLVSMIQGLGEKHQKMLPDEPSLQPVDEEEELMDRGRVRKWARAVSENAEDGNAPTGEDNNGNDEDRVQRFDRPLKEIRVGESPSRPWGVSIPAKYFDKRETRASSVSSNSAQIPDDVKNGGSGRANQATDQAHNESQNIPAGSAPPQQQKGKCPFDHAVLLKSHQPDSAFDTVGEVQPSYKLPARSTQSRDLVIGNPMPMANPNEDDQAGQPQDSQTQQQDANAQGTAPPPHHPPQDTAEQPAARPQLPPLTQYDYNDNAETAPQGLNQDIETNLETKTIVNRGVAMIYGSETIEGYKLVNEGTLFMGYGYLVARRAFRQVLENGGQMNRNAEQQSEQDEAEPPGTAGGGA